MKILIAEDDPGSRRLLEKYLTAKGFDVMTAADGSEALHQFVAADPDMVLLDVNMPEMDGWAVLEEIREMSRIPVIMLTVRGSTADKVKGLSAGADDYVAKPFDLKEIEARIHAISRRTGSAERKDALIRVGELTIDDEAKEVKLGDDVVSLSPKEYELLHLLASRPGRVFSTKEILENVWSERIDSGCPEDVKKYIYYLRGKLECDPEHPSCIETVRGFGYKLVGHGPDR